MQQNHTNPYAINQRVVQGAEDEASELAGRWLRLGAALIDVFTLAVVFYPLAYFGFRVPLNGLVLQDPISNLIASLASVGLYVLFNGYLLHMYGQTVGKRLLGIRVVNLDGSKATLQTLLLKRYLVVQLIAEIPLIGFLVSVLNALFIFREDRRCLHDLIAGTKVVMA